MSPHARRPRRFALITSRCALFAALGLTLVLASCAKAPQGPSLADQLAGDNRTVTQEARGLIVSLPGILFDFDKATLRPETISTLEQVAEVLRNYPTLEIRVEGHTDDVGSETYNQDLSERRALAVADFLVDNGIASSQVRSAGFGESLPVAPNDTADGRQRNRRSTSSTRTRRGRRSRADIGIRRSDAGAGPSS
ncbi:MAG: OmpA family protein [Candidatus Eisenbacteria bacterium]